MKKHLVFVFALLLVLLSCGSAFAVEISGNSPPTINGALPYYTSKTKIYEYVYTAERFKPGSDGKIFVCFYGQPQSSSPATTVTLKIEVNSTNYPISTKSVSGSNFPFTPQYCVSGLDPTKYYHGAVTKNNTAQYMYIKVGYGKSKAQARNFTFN